jgi:hypothetical protein
VSSGGEVAVEPVEQAGVADRQAQVLAEAEAGLAAPLPARGGPRLLASRPAPRGALADPAQAG